jgi:hypothetical protein
MPQDTRLLHLLRLSRRGRAFDDDFPADWHRFNGRVGGEDREGRGGQQEGYAEAKKG